MVSSSPLKVHRIEPLTPFFKEGSDGCLKCFYDLRRGEKLAGIEFAKDGLPFYIYKPFYDIDMMADEKEAVKITNSMITDDLYDFRVSVS